MTPGNTSVVRKQTNILGIRMGEVDRFLVPLDDAAIVKWFFDHLFVGHNLRERVRALSVSPVAVARGGCGGFSRCWMLEPPPQHQGSVIVADRRDGGWGAILEEVGAAAAHSLGRLGDPRLEVHPARCIFLRDYEGSVRRTVLVFAFPPGGRRPAVVVKVRPRDDGPSPLRSEWLALAHTRRRLPPTVRGGMPKARSFERVGDLDVLVMSSIPGRSAYVDLYQGLDPARRVGRHLAAAADWLAGFHQATRMPSRAYRPEHDPLLEPLRHGDGDPSPWYQRLLELSGRSPTAMCAGHGDFWARNLLLPTAAGPSSHTVGLVDWEHGSAVASPFYDLLQFPLTYGLGYPWARYRRLPVADAFRLTFLERNPVSQAVRQYFADYCARTGMQPALLLAHTHVQLLARARAAPPPRRGHWLECQRLLEQAATSALSS